MKKIFSLGLMLAALALTCCSKDAVEEQMNPAGAGAFELVADLDGGRTVADGIQTAWAAADAINVWTNVSGEKTYTSHGSFAIAEEDLATSTFRGTLAAELTEASYDWYAFYPYSKYNGYSSSSPAKTAYNKIADKAQQQDGNNNQKHIAGANAPLYGVALGVAAGEKPALQFKHLSTLVKVVVTNATDEPISIKNIKFETETEKISGTFYTTLTGDPTYQSSGDNYTYNYVNLAVTGAENIAAFDGKAEFYLNVCPFGAEAAETVTVTVTDGGDQVVTKTYTIPVGSSLSKPGKITTLNFTFEAPEESTIYSIPFQDNLSWLAAITHTNALAADELDEHYTAAAAIYNENNVLKFGSSNNRGSLTTAKFDLTQNFVVVVRAQTYGTDASELTVTAGTTTSAAVTLTGEFHTYLFDFDALTGAEAITINVAGKRGYVSYFAIEKQGYIPAPEVFVTSGDIAVDAVETSGTITYTVDYPVEGKEVTATTDATWINLGTPADGSLTYTIEANPDTKIRNATITLSYENGISDTIEVTQAAKLSDSAVTKEIIFADQNWANQYDMTSVASHTIEGITLTFVKISGSNPPKYYTSGYAVRMYKECSLTISAPGTMSKIVMTHVNNYAQQLAADTGSYSVSGNVGTWNGSASSVTLTHTASSQNRVTRIDVTYVPTE